MACPSGRVSGCDGPDPHDHTPTAVPAVEMCPVAAKVTAGGSGTTSLPHAAIRETAATQTAAAVGRTRTPEVSRSVRAVLRTADLATAGDLSDRSRILERVTSDLARFPAWVVRGHRAAGDAWRIAYVVATGHPVDGRRTDDQVRAGGVASAINWVTGGEPAPITHRAGVDVDLARSEWLIAGAVETGGPLPPVPGVVQLAVDDPRWAAGVGAALGWLLGYHDRPPVAIPRRRPDGRVLTADELYRTMVAARPRAAWTPEQRAAARRRAEQAAAASRSLAELAALAEPPRA